MTIESLFDVIPAHRIEYHRNVLALIPRADDPDPGVALLTIDPKSGMRNIRCSCGLSGRKKKCPHVLELSGAIRKTKGIPESGHLDDVFSTGIWHRLAKVLHHECPVKPEHLALDEAGLPETINSRIRILEPGGDILVECSLKGVPNEADPPGLLLERTGVHPPDGNSLHRGRVLDMLAAMTLTETEQVMRSRGMQSRRMAVESSFWYRLVYHYRSTMVASNVEITMQMDEVPGRFAIRFQAPQSGGMAIYIPRKATLQVKRALEKDFKHCASIPVWPDSLESIARVFADDQNNLKLNLCLLLHLPDGSTEVFERRRMAKHQHGNAFYIPEKKVLATWKTPDRLWGLFGGKYTKKIRKDKVPEIIEKIGDIFSPPNIVDPTVGCLNLHRACSRIEIDPGAIDRDWCWLSVHYGFGENALVSLADLYRARQSGKKYISVDDGWVDVRAVNLKTVTAQPGSMISGQLAEGKNMLRVSRMELLRMKAALEVPLQIRNPTVNKETQVFQSILEMRLRDPIGEISGLASHLRGYQHHGVEWLAFLHENHLGGLLCDEMGLGKTHQVMALMAWLANCGKNKKPGIVVCPTTVISHWTRKIQDHAPGLCAFVYHGTDRELPDMSAPGSVLITSYGLLLRDIEALSRLGFGVAAFDEAQYIKNPSTQSYQAAKQLRADIKLVVTGTPVENRLGDLKSLMDLVLPGYLGSDEAFRQRYEAGQKGRLAQLRRLVRPFALRRTKSAVLDELPEKIEDFRYCQLTDAQVKLYRDAIDGRGRNLMAQLEKGGKDIPYIHIFALLTLLKQICNHPATISGMDSSGLDSGKWELFRDLADACLENDEKIVVFSQFIPMVHMILEFFRQKGVGTASITGSTRKRGDEIERFNTVPDCRVFVGSIKAGGSGIDLTGGSVVIHYDRWWNAAREDQATDRVHRIGQTRGVQVFKLVTEGTLEEKISAIIDRKKNLMGDVVVDDDPGVLKTFTRDELMSLIAMPG